MVYIKRDIEEEISKYFKAKEIIAVIGARQCGKTTLVNNFLNLLGKKGKKINRISFDDVKLLQLFEGDIDSFADLHLKGYDILFIDEVQYSKDSGKKLKYLYDNFDTKIFISGSSAAELSIQSLKYLTGRIFIFPLSPFSFKEFLKARNQKLVPLYENGNYGKEIVSELNKHLREFILYGGYPRVALAKTTDEKKKILESIYNTYLLKEIREILDLSEDYRLVKLMKALSLQIGNIINYNELSTITSFSYNDLMKYLNILEKTFICNLVKPYYTNKRTEMVKSPKIYFYDLGFRNICIDNFSSERADFGNIYENFIYTELIKHNIFPNYWRTKSGAEVDFIIEKNNKLIPVEVKSLLKEAKLTRSFSSFLKKYSPKKGYVVSLDFEGKRGIVAFLPLVKLVNAIERK
ncbi:MAG: ATP-binding protein [Nanoarchaeota archaeon]|nr:ATP-binding protein [Nanoarchaeota archaeon]